jgi:hypothetical protein
METECEILAIVWRFNIERYRTTTFKLVAIAQPPTCHAEE